jgi:hypothetical protein
MSRKIEVIIDSNGNVNIETIGYVGTACEDVQKSFQKAIGNAVSSTDKPEKFDKVKISDYEKLSYE